jgi:alkaline phosphatase
VKASWRENRRLNFAESVLFQSKKTMKNNTILSSIRDRASGPAILLSGVLAMSQALLVGVHADVIPSTLPTAVSTPDSTKEYWVGKNSAALAKLKIQSYQLPPTRAKNVILFVGDGMGISTITASRIFEGQKVKNLTKGEENLLFFENPDNFPNAALSRTYSVNQQVSDSAPTMTAMVTGVKNNDGALSVVAAATKNTDATDAQKLKTILEQAKERGMSVGVVTTARVTHATPGACYAHTTNRNWENDNPADTTTGRPAGKTTKDIAAQVLDANGGKSLDVVLGGGRANFMLSTQADPEYPLINGLRTATGRDLIAEWKRLPNRVWNLSTGTVNTATFAVNDRSKYVWKKSDFDQVTAANTDRLLGLFEPSHVQYEADRDQDASGEPSLKEMTVKAIEILSKNRNGYFLMVEGGRIDHAHHSGNAYRALVDTVAFSQAIEGAARSVGSDTLMVVTADHSHVFTIAGYPVRGNPILGLVNTGTSASTLTKDLLGLPYTTLGYANGPGYTGASYITAAGTSGISDLQTAFGTGTQVAGGTYKITEGSKVTNSLVGLGLKTLGGVELVNYPGKVDGIAGGRPNLSGVDTQAKSYMQESTVPLSSETHAGEDVAIFARGPNAHLFRGTMEQSMIYWIMADALRLPTINASSTWPNN